MSDWIELENWVEAQKSTMKDDANSNYDYGYIDALSEVKDMMKKIKED